MSGFPPAVLRALKKRSMGVCEGCGLAQATEAHHRQFRSRGGPEILANALHLCGWGNHTGCHGVAHTAVGEARGWAVRSGFDVLLVPVFGVVDFEGHWRRQDNDGGRELLLTGDAVEYMQLIHAIRVAS